jgi:DNA end-binding protein Ku
MVRPYWRGYLKLSLVNCPVNMSPATTETDKVKFHTLNADTGNKVASRYVDAVSGKPVDDDETAKGYERGPDEFIVIEDDELEAVAVESARVIDVDRFVPRDTIEWIWLEKPYFLTPGDPVGDEAYSVIRDAMKATDMVGISRLVMGRRERAVMLEARDNGIVLWTLRYGDEVRDEEIYFSGVPDRAAEPELMPLMQQLIRERTERWRPEMTGDPVQAKLLELISEKKKALKKIKAETSAPEAAAKPANVVNIMDALRKSIAEQKARKAS